MSDIQSEKWAREARDKIREYFNTVEDEWDDDSVLKIIQSAIDRAVAAAQEKFIEIKRENQKLLELRDEAFMGMQELLGIARGRILDPDERDGAIDRAEWRWKRIAAPLDTIGVMAEAREDERVELRQQLAAAQADTKRLKQRLEQWTFPDAKK